jgi:hypothetical protein
MDRELQKKLLEYVTNAESFLGAELPVYFNEFITYHWYASLFYLMCSLLIFLMSLSVFYFIYKVMTGQIDLKIDGEAFGMTMMCTIIISVIAFISSGTSIVYYGDRLFKISAAPRVFVIDTLRK